MSLNLLEWCPRLILLRNDDEQFKYSYGATGTTVRCNDKIYIITATHTLTDERRAGRLIEPIIETPHGCMSLSINKYASILSYKDRDHALCDITAYEVGKDAKQFVNQNLFPDILIDGDPLTGLTNQSRMLVTGYPSDGPEQQLSFDPPTITPVLYNFQTVYDGPSDMLHMSRVRLLSNRVSMGANHFDLNFPNQLNGMCGSPVFSLRSEGPRLAGIVTMAGRNHIQFINIVIILTFLRNWQSGRGKRS